MILTKDAMSPQTLTESSQGVDFAVSGQTDTPISRRVETNSGIATGSAYLAMGALGATSLAGGNQAVAAKRPAFANIPSFEGHAWFCNHATAGKDHSQQRERST